MLRILDIAQKDLTELLRDKKVFLFLLIMPIAFTMLFGLAFSGSGEAQDDRLPVGFVDEDGGVVSAALRTLLEPSSVIRLVEDSSLAGFEQQLAEGELAAVIVVPEGYSDSAVVEEPLAVEILLDSDHAAADPVQAELLAAAGRVANAARAARVVAAEVEGTKAALLFDQALQAWEVPPIAIRDTSHTTQEETGQPNPMAVHNTSPGMMLQFAIAGLLTAAQMLVNERKSRSLQRLLTTTVSRSHILLGHFLAIFALIFTQFVLLISFGQLVLGVQYMASPLGTLLVALATALCISALGLLIGALARTDEQAIIFAMIPMFLFAGLGGAWMPLEFTSPSFQLVGHLSPVAWAMDGFKNISARGLGVESVLLPAAVLLGYALLFFGGAVLRLRLVEEQ